MVKRDCQTRLERGLNSDRMVLSINKHITSPDMIGPADEAIAFHPLDQARSTVIADAKLALDIAG